MLIGPPELYFPLMVIYTPPTTEFVYLFDDSHFFFAYSIRHLTYKNLIKNAELPR